MQGLEAVVPLGDEDQAGDAARVRVVRRGAVPGRRLGVLLGQEGEELA